MKFFLIAFAGIFSLWSLSPSNSAPGKRNTNHKTTTVIDNPEQTVRNLYNDWIVNWGID